MSDTVTVLLAAFGGGLAGAVLQPAVSYVLQRVRSGEEIRKRQERSLRRMVEWELAWGSRVSAAVVLSPHLTEQHRFDMVKLDAGNVVWQPERIGDRDLQQMARECAKLTGGLFQFALHPGKGEEAADLRRQLEALQSRITLRMDELNWPEADD